MYNKWTRTGSQRRSRVAVLNLSVTTTVPNQLVKLDSMVVVRNIFIASPTVGNRLFDYIVTYDLKRDGTTITTSTATSKYNLRETKGGGTSSSGPQSSEEDLVLSLTFTDQPPDAGKHTYTRPYIQSCHGKLS
jgi:hypothetical protein